MPMPESFFVYQFLSRVENKLKLYKKATGQLDFDDMLLGVLEALKGPGAQNLIEALRQRWRFALVDEFQDTDAVQWEIFKTIFIEGSRKQHLVVIGDPKQAIYGFRGADVYTYDAAKKQMLGPNVGATRLPLTKNYRSTALIIEAVNRILLKTDDENNTFFSGLNRYDEPVESGRPDKITLDAKGQPLAPVVLPSFNSGDKVPGVGALKNALYPFYAKEITRLLSAEGTLCTSCKETGLKPITASDIYLLTQSNRESLELGEVLRRFKVPFAYYKQEGLFQTDEAKNIYTLLMAISEPFNQKLRLKAWLTPFFALPLEELPRLSTISEGHRLVDLLYRWHLLAARQDWGTLFEQILSDSGLNRRLIFAGDERALTNYLHLFELLLAQTHTKPLSAGELARTLKAYIDELRQVQGRDSEVQRLESDEEAVKILTMHKAKGLEAEVVFIAGGFSGTGGREKIKTSIYHQNRKRHLHIGPATGIIDEAIKKEEEEENERLLYVAITRAKSRLYLPFFHRKNAFSRCPYGKIQKQLELLNEEGALGEQKYFQLKEISLGPAEEPKASPENAFYGWAPGELLKMPESRAQEAAGLKNRAAGVILTSYSRIKQGQSWRPQIADKELPEELPQAAVELWPALSDPKPGKDELPGGRLTGLYLHSLLEEVSFAEIIATSFAGWSKKEQVQKLAHKRARQYAMAEEHVTLALKLVYSTLNLPLQLTTNEGQGLLKIPRGLASLTEFTREMPFFNPIPESWHPLLKGGSKSEAKTEGPMFAVGRGYLQGLIDLVFKHEGRYYLLDWKSDRLNVFSEKAVAQHVENNYKLQAVIYSLAVTRMLKINSETDYDRLFGGVLYAFLRGLNRGSAEDEKNAFWFSKPAFSTLAHWETQLLERRAWGV